MSYSSVKKLMLVVLVCSYSVLVIENFLFLDPVQATISSEKIDYRSPVNGVVQSLSVKKGDAVSSGDPLFEVKRFAVETEEQKQARLRIDNISFDLKSI